MSYDSFYADELAAREDKYKATEAEEKELLTDAEFDLAACKKAQEELEKSSAVEQKQKLTSAEQDSKLNELKKEQETKYIQAEQAKKANY